LKYVKYRGVLLNERGKYSISDAQRKECDRRGCTIGSWQVICFLRFSKNLARKRQMEARSVFVNPYTLPHPTAIPTEFWGMKFFSNNLVASEQL
jgi:hypothetical protein